MPDEGRLRIAMISYYLPSGSKIGVGYQVHQLASELSRRGHQVVVYSNCPPVEGATYEHRHVVLTGVMRTFRFATALRRVDFSTFDVLHAHGDDYWLWRRRVAAHVRTLHGSCFEEALRIRGVVERLRMVALGVSEVLASVVADRTIVVSPATRRWTPWVSTVIPNGVDRTRFSPGVTREDRPTVLFVGTWGGRKQGALLAREFHEVVVPRLPEARLWMVTQDAPSDLPPEIVSLGRVSDDDLADRYRRSWVFCLPSTYEGFGIPYAEAMSSGVPVVATPNVGARYVTDEGTCGVLTAEAGLGVAVAELLEDDQRRARLVDAGLQRAEFFGLTAVADAYENVYREVLARGRRPASRRPLLRAIRRRTPAR